jgi:ADP-heptose:LPS heptosyltransferase
LHFPLMRLVDKSLGTQLCRLVALGLWLCRKHIRHVDHPPSPEPGTVRNILVMKFLGMGSILQATPLFQALRQRYPQARLTLLTFHSNKALADLGIGVDEFVTVDTSSLRRFVASNARALWRLRQVTFDVLINLEFFATYAVMLTLLLKKRFAIAFGGFANYRTNYYHDFVSYDSAQHVQQKFLNFARRLGFVGPTPALARLSIPMASGQEVLARMQQREGFSIRPGDYVLLVNINTGDMAPHRRWPAEHFRAVVNRLLPRRDVRCVLIGGPQDRKGVSQFQSSLAAPEKAINLAGRISLAELVALMQLSNLYFGNDSGPLHFAACVGLPVLALFGPESPAVYGPPATPQNTVLYRAEPCGPCLNVYTDKRSRCGANVCLSRITPEQVREVIEDRYLPPLTPAPRSRQSLPLVGPFAPSSAGELTPHLQEVEAL